MTFLDLYYVSWFVLILPQSLIPIAAVAVVAAWQGPRVEVAEVGATSSIQRMVATAVAATSTNTGVGLLNGQRLVWAVESRPWDVQDERWWLDGHC